MVQLVEQLREAVQGFRAQHAPGPQPFPGRGQLHPLVALQAERTKGKRGGGCVGECVGEAAGWHEAEDEHLHLAVLVRRFFLLLLVRLPGHLPRRWSSIGAGAAAGKGRKKGYLGMATLDALLTLGAAPALLPPQIGPGVANRSHRQVNRRGQPTQGRASSGLRTSATQAAGLVRPTARERDQTEEEGQ